MSILCQERTCQNNYNKIKNNSKTLMMLDGNYIIYESQPPAVDINEKS
jgi:hypothetical protein